MKQIMLCAICSLNVGNCSEDCGYCTQSAKVDARIEKYKLKTIEEIIYEAKIASNNHALGFCLVTSGKNLNDTKLELICRAAKEISKELPNLMLIACNGMASYEALKELKSEGVFSYNHNLETSREYFAKICTTHTWDERFETNLNAKRAGLALCCGGIYGLGESNEDRVSFRNSLKELDPFSTPINFFIPHAALPIKQEKLSQDEALRIIKDTKEALPNARVMIAGGREAVLKERQYEVFDYGAEAIVIGDYLTAKGEVASSDIKELTKRGYSFATLCH
ncbi:biotin synthase [Campylobacter sp. RM15925]|uniref:biotin synthase n=1 Tax=Campylobacter sp. RM15925 TaxID=1705724 RepID=UPI001474EEE6|nr:biotin synthase [Campylobacter sp. RM15925]